MAGRYGGENNTKQNIRVYKVDHDKNLLFVIGSIPGNNKSIVLIKDAAKKIESQFGMLPYPTFIEEKNKSYPNVMEWEGMVDMNEVYQHDNDEILGNSEEEDEGGDEKGEDDFGKK
jgi:hypothetical protein